MVRKKVYKEKVDFHINRTTIMESARPVDTSFLNLTSLNIPHLPPATSGRVGKAPLRESAASKYLSRAIWINNNRLTDIKYLDKFVNLCLEFPERLGWLDLSFNYIKTLDSVILKFTNLKILYLHGNCISDIQEIVKLENSKNLKCVTFYGNPISNISHYRGCVMGLLPQVKVLDHSPILKKERFAAIPPQIADQLRKTKEAATL